MIELIINGRFLCQTPTGVQRASREFVLALDRLLSRGRYQGLKVRLIAPRKADVAALQLQSISVELLHGGAGYFWEQVALPWHVGNRRLLCLGNAAPIMSLVSNSKVAVMLHDQSYRLFPRDYGLAYRLAHSVMDYFILRRAQPLITVSHSEAEHLRRSNSYTPPKIVVAPNGSWTNDKSSLPDAAPRSSVGFVLYVGGFSDRKNVESILSATLALAEQGISSKLVGQPNNTTKAFWASLSTHLQDLITFTGFVDDHTLAQYYQNATCLIYPSLYEASGLPPSEAMHFGCPVVVSDLPVLRERCGPAALYCSPHDPASIVARVVEIANNPKLASDLSTHGIAWSNGLTWENQANIILDAILYL